MASLKLLVCLVLISVISFQACYSSSKFNRINVLESKVNLTLYYESLCPACRSFIVDDLAAALFDPDKDLISTFPIYIFTILLLFLLPLLDYDHHSVMLHILQHGPNECYFNGIEACTINLWSDVKQHFNLIHCIETKLNKEGIQDSKEQAWTSCCKELKMDPHGWQNATTEDMRSRKLIICQMNEMQLILKNANETDNLVPPHQYVPWVIVNGKPLKTDYLNFVSHACNAYKDSPKPKACRSLPPTMSTSGGIVNSRVEGCYNDERGGSS